MTVWLCKILEHFRFSSDIVQIDACLGQGHREGWTVWAMRKLLRVMEMFHNFIVVSWVHTCVMDVIHAHMYQNSSNCTFYMDTMSCT